MNIREYTAQAAKALIANPDFQTAVATARQSSQIADSGLADDASIEVWYKEHIYGKPDAEKPLDDAVAGIIFQFQLSPDWRHSIKRYVLLNNPLDMQLPMHIEVGAVEDEQTGQWRVVAYIPEYASQRDIKDALPKITEWQEKLRTKTLKRQPVFNDELAKEAYAIYRRVKSYQKTAAELSEKTQRKISQEQARDLIRNYKERIGITWTPNSTNYS